jgi:protein disulfide-isomerase A1
VKSINIKLTLLCFVFALFAAVNTVDIPNEGGVLVLTEENFDEAIASHDNILVEFYAPWCGHCKKIAPELEKASEVLAKETPALYIAKIDTTVHKAIGTRYNIEGFPTLKLFSKGVPSEYNGGRTEPEIISWMIKKTGPASRVLSTVEEVESFQASADVAVVLFSADEGLLSTYESVARSNDDILFAHCGVSACQEKYTVQPGTVVLFKKFDDGRVDIATFDEASLKAFVQANSSPLVMSFDEKCAQLVFGKSVSGIFLYRDKNSETSAALDTIMKAAAVHLKGKIQVVITDITEGLETRLAEYIGMTAADLPSVRIHDTRSDLKKYTMNGEITEANIMSFVDAWTNGKLEATLKSEEIPTEQKENVYTLVGKSFDTIVMDPTKDVLVEFYAPWCGHCKKIAPILEELATNLKHNTNLIIAKMDSTLNEVANVSVQGFPTIKFFPANNKAAPMDFNGDRTVEGFTKFLTENSVSAVKAKDDL